jgi:hypothetical protein
MSKINKKNICPPYKGWGKKKPAVNKARIESKIHNLVENGRNEITTKKQLEKYPIGSLISFETKSGTFRFGGFITKFSDDSFIYITPDFTKKFRGIYKNIGKMWVGDVYKVKNDLISLAETTQNKTNFGVKVNDIVIFYARSSFDVKRFKNTDKYKRLMVWNDYFNGNDE